MRFNETRRNGVLNALDLLATSPVVKRAIVLNSDDKETVAIATKFLATINVGDEKSVGCTGDSDLQNHTRLVLKGKIKPWHRMLCLFGLGIVEQLYDHFSQQQLEAWVPSLEADINTCLAKLAKIAETQGYLALCDTLKHIYTCWLALYLENPLPSSASRIDPIFVTGRLRRFIRLQLAKKNSPRSRHFFCSIQQNKRCSDVVPSDFILNSLHKHKTALTYVPKKRRPAFWSPASFDWSCVIEPPAWDEPPRYLTETLEEDLMATYEEDIAAKAEIVFRKLERFKRCDYWTGEISRKSCFENTLGCGGSQGHLRLRCPLDTLDHEPSDYQVREMKGKPLKEYGDISDSWCREFTLVKMDYSPHTGVLEARARSAVDYRRVWYRAVRECGKDALICTVWPVTEPLKVRNITKGQSAPYAIAKQMQQWVYRFLKDQPQFALIGGVPVSQELVKAIRRGDAYKWVSGDFSAATDKLSSRVTRIVSGVLKGRMTDEEWSIFSKVLYDHDLRYDEKCLPRGIGMCEKDLDLFETIWRQKNGQLMGSVLSFPFLCVANFIAFWQAVHPNLPYHEVKRLVLVNGDDILFQANEEEYDTWTQSVEAMGFELSLGKNFFHKNFLCVNSLPMWEEEKVLIPGVKEVNITLEPFHNIALALNISKVQTKVSTEVGGHRAMPAIYAEYIKGAWNKERAQARFLHYQREAVQFFSNNGKYNLYLPCEYGGLGMTDHMKTGYLTNFQIRVAELYFEAYSSTECFLKAPVQGYVPPPQSEKDRTKIDPQGMIVLPRMKRYSFDPEDTECVDTVIHTWNSSSDLVREERKPIFIDPNIEKKARNMANLVRIGNGGKGKRTSLQKVGEHSLLLPIPRQVLPLVEGEEKA